MSNQMSGVVNSYWASSFEYNPPSTAGVFRWDGMEITYQLGIVPAYCGAYFLYDFIYNERLHTMYRNTRDSRWTTEETRKKAASKLRAFFRRFKYHLGIHLTKARANPVDWPDGQRDREYYAHPYKMQCTLWEVDSRAMYFGAQVMSGKKAKPVTNPNSGNTAAFFMFEFDSEYYVRMYRRYGTDWCKQVYHNVRNYPYDVADEDGNDESDYNDLEEW